MHNSIAFFVVMMAVALAVPAASAQKDKAAEPRAEYNVRDFGALGDGVSDDATAFQSAIDEAYISGGGLVVVPGSTKGLRAR